MKKKDFILGLYFMLIAGVVSICKGMDRSFDVRNYHIYNPYAFLNNRLTTDIMPADIQSYFNPILDIPYFYMVKFMNNYPFVITFIQGFSYALLLFIIYKTAQLIFKGYNKTLLTILSVLIGGTAALTLYNIGTLTHDIFVGDMILISIYLILKSFEKHSIKNLIISGLVLGCICGLKLTAGIFGAAMTISLVCFLPELKRPISSIFCFIISAAAGFLITNGFWLYTLYTEFGNPFIPYFNNIFNSDFVNCGDMLKEDFLNLYPQNIMEYLFFPFYFYQHLPTKAFELNYQDFRFAAIYVVLIINLIVSRLFKSDTEKYGINFNQINFLFVISTFTYIIWINTFATVRYLTPIASLSGIIILASLIKFFDIISTKFNLTVKNIQYENINFNLDYKKTVLPIILICAGLYLTFTTIEPSMLKRIPITNKALDIDTVRIPDDAIVVTVSGSAILIPFQNPKAKYVYLNATRFTERNVNILSVKTQTKIINMIKDNPDNVYFMMDMAIYNRTMRLTQTALMNYTGIDFNKSACKIVNTNIANKKTISFYVLCKAEIK